MNTQELMTLAAPLIERAAKSLSPQRLADPDLVQEGTIAVLEQLPKWDEKKVSFPAWAYQRARYAMIEYIAANYEQTSGNYKLEEDSHMPDWESWEEPEEPDAEEEPTGDVTLDGAIRAQMADHAQGATGVGGEVLRRYYGFRPHPRAYTLKEISRSLQIPLSTVHRELQQTVDSIREKVYNTPTR